MHTCPTCGKKMATAGGLEIHEQLTHAAPTQAAPEADLEVVPAAGVSAARVADVPPIVRPRSGTKATGVPALSIVIVMLLLAGIASAVLRNGGERSPLALVQAASATTADAKTARVSATVKTDSGPLAGGVNVDGGYDFANHRARLEVDAAKYGIPGVGKVSAVMDYSYGVIGYIKFPPAIAAELDGKPWVKFDLSALLRQLGVDVDIASLLQGQSNDPTSGLALLQGADNVVTIGTEQVRGVDTTHYRLDVSIDKAIADAETPEKKDAITKLANLYTVRTFPVEVWLDGEGRLRRFQESLDTGTIRLPQGALTQGDPFRGHVTITYEVYDFGASVDTELPPADQVTDLNQLLRRATDAR